MKHEYEKSTGGDTGGDPVAEIRGLRVAVDGRAIVDGVDLRVLPGRVTALIGASGSGKTTTGLALLGEYPAGAHVTGDVRVEAGGLVGYVPQHPAAALNPARRVSALLTDIARAQVRHLPVRQRRAAARERVLRALTEAQLADAETLLRRYPHQLSGGQQQRVVLAQALLLGARVVVADEPTTGQDALTKSRIVERFRAVAARGIAVVLLSHDLDVVRALADEVVVLRAGRVVESGPAGRVRSSPRHEWTRELFGEQAEPPDPDEPAGRPGAPARGLPGTRTEVPDPQEPAGQPESRVYGLPRTHTEVPDPQEPARTAGDADTWAARPAYGVAGHGRPHRPHRAARAAGARADRPPPRRRPRHGGRPARPRTRPVPGPVARRRRPVRQRQDHPGPLSRRPPPGPRRRGPPGRRPAAAKPARPHAHPARGRAVRLPGRARRLRRAPSRRTAGRPHRGPPARHRPGHRDPGGADRPGRLRATGGSWRTGTPAGSPAANSSAPPSPAPCSPAPASWSATRSPPASTRSPAGASSTCSPRWSATATNCPSF
ncbi:ABC-type dipeptide/oligopeptide/nickel transport system ATPase component [Streptomyces sp. SAI-229]